MEHRNEDSAYFLVDRLETDFDQLMVECANVIDEVGGYVKLPEPDGRDMFAAEWIDAEDVRCYLRSFVRIDPATALNPPEKQKFRTDYFLSRETSLPDTPDEKYYFTSVRKSVEACDKKTGVGVINQDIEDDQRNLAVVLRSLQSRPTRRETDQELQQIAVDMLIDHNTVVRALIKRIDQLSKHAKNRLTVERAMQFIMDKEPILQGKTDIVRQAVDAERTRLKLAGTQQLELE